MRINNNLMAMNTHRQLGLTNANSARGMEKLSSGYRINRAGDDAAGLAISEKMRAQIRGLDQASRNSQDGISMIQTAEGALSESQAILQRMRELAVQSANDTNVDVDRDELQKEVNQLTEELTRIAQTTEFNTQNLLDGTLDNRRFQIGANQDQNIALSIADMGAQSLGVVSDITTMGQSGAGVKGVEADLGFDLTGFNLTATAGGAIAARLTGDNDPGIVIPKYAEDIETKYAAGITHASGSDDWVFDGNITLGGAMGGGISWADNLDSAGNNDIVIEHVGTAGSGHLEVTIRAQNSDGVIFTSTNDIVTKNSDGHFIYDAHGVNFTITSLGAAGVGGELTFDIEEVRSPAGSAAGSWAVDSNITIVQGTPGNTHGVTSNIISDIAVTADDLLDNSSFVDVNVTGIGTDGSAVVTVIISGTVGGSNPVSTDIFTFDATASLSTTGFAYDNHGISFTLNLTGVDRSELNEFRVTQALNVQDNVVNISGNTDARTLAFSLKATNGTDANFTLEFSAGHKTLEDIKDAINAEWSGSDIASLNTAGDRLIIESNFAGDSTINVTSDLSNIFDTTAGADLRVGASESVDLTFSDGTTTLTETIAPSSKSVSFVNSDGDRVKFDLRGFDSLSGVNVGQAFSASDFARDISGIDISSHEKANEAITVINDAIEAVSAERSKLGAMQNRLDHTIKNLDNVSENLQASESRIRDVDMAKEMMEFTKNNILQQAAQAMLAQANQAPQGVLQLLR